MSPAAILLYHRVADEQDPFDLCIAPSLFAAHMKYVRRHCTVMSLDALAAAIHDDAVPPRAVAVTLDDGYVDNLEVASPILETFGVPATFFVTTLAFEEPHEFWWDTLGRLLLDEPELPGVLDVEVEPPLRVSFSDPASRRDALAAIHARLRCLDARRRNEALETIRRRLERHTRRGPGPMGAAQVRALADRPGHSVGAHTVRHLSLPAQDRDTQMSEMRGCREALERLLQRPVNRIAYPFGETSAETTGIAASAGFTVGVVVERCGTGSTDLLELPRIEPQRFDQPLDVALERFFRRQS